MNTEFEKEAKKILHLNGCQQHSHGYNEGIGGGEMDMERMEELEAITLREIVEAHNQHLRTVLVRLRNIDDQHLGEEGYGRIGPLVTALDAEIAKLETNHE